MNTSSMVAKVAVIGSGISGAVCASTLAKNGIAVTLFDSARGPGGRMSQRREISDDGKELVFDHGAPFFSAIIPEALHLIHTWEARGIVSEWKEKLETFDCTSRNFINSEKEGISKKYVGVPGMNSICKALCHQPGVETRFGAGVGRLEWREDENLWQLTGLDGNNLGSFRGVVASDKNIVSPRFTDITGRPPPLDASLIPEFALVLREIPVYPCFALMLAFSEPLHLVSAKGFSFVNSEILGWAYCDSSKPGRVGASECWVLHSTMEYAKRVIAETGLGKPSSATLSKVTEDLLQEFQSIGLNVPHPIFKRAHRWGSAFPATSVARDERCLFDREKKVAICGDFCVSPNVEGAILSGLAAASKLTEILSCL